jgi:hypothetical protein
VFIFLFRQNMQAAVEGKARFVVLKTKLVSSAKTTPCAQRLSVNETGSPSFLFLKQASRPDLVNPAVAVKSVAVTSITFA